LTGFASDDPMPIDKDTNSVEIDIILNCKSLVNVMD
jgi:hypothetical protein